MHISNNINTNELVTITEDFINFLAKLYNEGAITYEQYDKMTALKKEFLDSLKVES